jgi:hypothetical protein
MTDPSASIDENKEKIIPSNLTTREVPPIMDYIKRMNIIKCGELIRREEADLNPEN